MAVQIQLRRDTAANWTSVNPTLAEGEMGWELDTGKAKLGNGADDWATLPYAVEPGGGGATDFIDLGDVPASYTGEGGKLVAVKATEDGLEFVAASGGAVDSVNGQTGAVVLALDDLDDVDAATPTDGYVLTWNNTDGEWQAAAPTGGMTNPMTTAGDIIIGGSSGTPQRLAAGTDTYVLTMVSGAPAWAAAGGGGGLTNWTDGLNSSSPNATVPVASLAATNAATNVDAAIVPKGSGALSAHIADGSGTGGNKRGVQSTDWQRVRTLATEVASGTQSVIGGGGRNTASGAYATVAGGYGGTISGSYAVIGGGESNTIGSGSSNRGFIGAGYFNSIGNNSSSCAIPGGQSNTIAASVNYSAHMGGVNNSITASNAAVTGGANNSVDAEYGRAGGYYSHTRAQVGCDAWASGRFSANGDAQVRRHVLRSATTDATPAALRANTSAASATNQVVLPNSSAFDFRGRVVVRENATGDCKVVSFEGLIRRGANAASTALVAAVTPVVVAEDAGAASWTVAISADTTNGTLRIDVTGEASHNLKWTGFVETVEVVG